MKLCKPKTTNTQKGGNGENWMTSKSFMGYSKSDNVFNYK